jgi:hypothetical protein
MRSVVEFKREVLDWAEQVGVAPKEIHVRSMSKKWASCSNRGRVTFSFALLNQSHELRAKAIVHELLHMKYPNHGKMFNSSLISHLEKRGIDGKLVQL